MAESSYPVGVGTRTASDSQYEALAATWSAPGILGVPTDTLVVYADGTGTRVVKIRANKRGIIRGWGWYSGTVDLSLPSLAANSSGSTRIDTVVLRFSRSSYTVVAAVVTGTPGAGAPALTQSIAEPLTSGTFEVPLATVSVANGATTISSGNVTPVTWYSEGPQLVLSSTATYQPPVNIGVSTYRHSDTGLAYELVSGAWRRTLWDQAWGVIGGTWYTGNGPIDGYIGNFFNTPFTDSNMRTGNVSLLAGRRYLVHAQIAFEFSASSSQTWIGMNLRRVSGGVVIGDKAVGDFNGSGDYVTRMSAIYTPSSNETANFGLWGQVNAYNGFVNWIGIFGDAGLTYMSVEDMGPTGKFGTVAV